MYIFVSILASICLGFMIYLDHVLFSRVSIKFSMLFKSIALLAFSLIFLATKESFNRIFDFQDIEWLFLILIGVSGLVCFFTYNLGVRNQSAHKTSVFAISSLLLFINIFFLIFSKARLVHKDKISNLVLVIIELVLLVAIILSNILLNKESKKVNMIFMGVSMLSISGISILLAVKKPNTTVLMIRQTLEVFLFWIAILCLIASILFFILFKEKGNEEINSKKKVKTPWQHYILVGLSCLMGIMAFSLAYGANGNYEDSVPAAINMVMGLSFLLPLIIHLFFEFKTNKNVITVIKNNRVLLGESVILVASLVLYLLAATL